MPRKDHKAYKLSGSDSPLSPGSINSSIQEKPVCSETYGKFQESILQWIDDQELPDWRPQRDEVCDAFKFLKKSRKPEQAKEFRKERTEAVKARRALFNKNRDQFMLAMLHSGRAYICMHPECDEIRNLHVDHIIPLSKGGSDELSNLQFLCRKHNCEKGSKCPISYS